MGEHRSGLYSVLCIGALAMAVEACGGDGEVDTETPGAGGEAGEQGGAGGAAQGGVDSASGGESGATDPSAGGEAGRASDDGTAGESGSTAPGSAGASGAAGASGDTGEGGEAGASNPATGGAGGEGGGAATPRDPRCDDAIETALIGAGSTADPYLVCLAEQLALLGTGEYTLDLAFALGDELDVSELEPEFATIGDAATLLTGTFDGRGHSVAGLRTALFAGIEPGGAVSDLALFGEADASLEPIRWGFLTSHNRGLVERVRVTGTLAAPSHAGLLVGWNDGVLEGCSSHGAISGAGAHVGGLVGVNEGTVRRSFSAATVTATQRVGGLVGRQSNESASMKECYAVGAVSGTRSVGGLVGSLFGGEIVDSFARSQAVDGGEAGGLVGDVTGTGISITNTYAAALTLTGEGAEGLVGEVGTDSEYVVTASYFHDSATGALGMALSSAAMQSASSYDGWDFTSVWELDASVEYPTLRAFGP